MMGAEVHVEHGYIHAKASRLKGARIDLDFPTVTGTENLIMAACLAKGTTSLHHVAREPEISRFMRVFNQTRGKNFRCGD